jgi:glutathione S-transferase
MAARHLGIPLTEVKVDSAAAPAELTDTNPLGKIPTLTLDDGRAIFDSRAIMHFLDRSANNKLYPLDHDARTDVEVLEALCDGITDALIAIAYERRFRPAEIVHQPWIDRQWAKATRGLDHIAANLPETSEKLHAGHFALAAMIGYLDLRYAGLWEEGRAALVSWAGVFAGHFPQYGEMKSRL